MDDWHRTAPSSGSDSTDEERPSLPPSLHILHRDKRTLLLSAEADGTFLRVQLGRLALLATIPIGLMLYLSMRLPWAITRYRLTNRRVMIERGINPTVEQYVDLDRFDAIDLVVSPGQEWYAAGDLVFRRGPIETLRLSGVSRPESFRQTCLKVRQSYVTVAAAQREAVGAA